MVESDCLEAVRMLHSSFLNGASITLVRDIRKLCSQDWQVSFHHVLRTGNRVADALAKLTDSSSFDVLQFVIPPLCVDRFLREDRSSSD
ncbi:hypothetical protein V6N12_062908 [Hibiscus sabdariffa]|uniref:RNase H type-1 domain-containing protein n=1 Tax=Hibiscus sabdariffa TaxID=183260 RepID=A0ABR2FAG7_9ROSI